MARSLNQEMLSRVADALYWMSRYIERAEDITRILTVNYHAILDLPSAGEDETWEPLIEITGDRTIFEEVFGPVNGMNPYTARNVSEFLLWHSANPNAITNCIFRARENARSVREQISSEMWEALNRLYFAVKDVNKFAVLRGPADFFTLIRDNSHMFQGITHATLNHDDRYEFIQIGKHIERADKTSRILDVKYASLHRFEEGSTQAALQLMAMLRSCSAMEAFQKKSRQLLAWRVAEFLLLSGDFPRSVRFCVSQCQQAVNKISSLSEQGPMRSSPLNGPQRALGRLVNDLEYIDIHDVLGTDMHPYLDQLQQRLNQAGDEIARTFFNTQVILPGAKNFQQAQQQQ